jgi:hypothetical protein
VGGRDDYSHIADRRIDLVGDIVDDDGRKANVANVIDATTAAEAVRDARDDDISDERPPGASRSFPTSSRAVDIDAMMGQRTNFLPPPPVKCLIVALASSSPPLLNI